MIRIQFAVFILLWWGGLNCLSGCLIPKAGANEVRDFIKSIKVNYPVALGEEQTKALFDKGETLPVTIVIDKKGIVREVIQGIIYPEEFEQKVKPLLR